MNSPTSTFTSPTASDAAKRAVDNSAEAAHEALSSTRRAANRTFDSLSSSVDNAHEAAAPVVQHAVERTQQIGNQAMGAVRNGALQLREQAQHARDASVVYVRQEPIKSVFIAAAVGAGLMAIASLMMQSRQHGR